MSQRSYTISLLLVLGVFYATVFGQAGIFHPLLLIAFLSPFFDGWLIPKAVCMVLLLAIVTPFFINKPSLRVLGVTSACALFLFAWFSMAIGSIKFQTPNQPRQTDPYQPSRFEITCDSNFTRESNTPPADTVVCAQRSSSKPKANEAGPSNRRNERRWAGCSVSDFEAGRPG